MGAVGSEACRYHRFDMELRQLKYFVAVAEELSFTRAAARVPVAIGALSTQVRRLEGELGVRLFERTTHSVTLTAPGAQFLAVARSVLAALDDGIGAVRRAVPTTVMTLAVVEEGLAELTQPVIDAFRTRFPQVDLRVVPCPASALFDRIETIDAIFWVHPPPPFPGWEFAPIVECDPVAVLSTSHPLASAARLPAAALLNETFVRVPEQARRWFDRHYLDDVRGGPPVAVSAVEVRDVPGGQSLVTMDGAIMVQPIAKLRYFNRPGLTWIRVDGIAPFPLGIAYRRDDERPTIRGLVEVAFDICDIADLGEGSRPARQR